MSFSRKANLNQLRVLMVLLRESNLSRASEVLGLTQPTLSAALKQLRKDFDDPLLVRVGKTMELTAKAKALVEPLEKVFDAVDTLWRSEVPDPHKFSRRFLIGTTDYGAALIAPRTFNAVLNIAPGLPLQFVDVPEHMPAVHRENDIDFYLVPDAICRSPSFQGMKFIPLFEEKFVYVVNKKHRLAGKKNIKDADLSKEVFAAYHIGGERYSMAVRKSLAMMEKQWNVGLHVQQFSVLPMIAQETDSVAIMPLRLAEKLAEKFDCVVLGESRPAIHFTFCLMWDPVHQSDPAHKFVKNLIRDLFAETFGGLAIAPQS
jgi:DNA-binding transcriptional LysR family regulator